MGAEKKPVTNLVLAGFPARDLATETGRRLVANGHAKAVNILPAIASIYVWEGEMVERSESLLLVKTPPYAARTIIETIKSNHPYDVPSILCVACCDGDTDYLNWLNYRN